MRVEVRPRRNHAGTRHESERRLHSHDTGELRRNSIGPAVIGAECREGQPACDRDGRAGARSARRTCACAVVRIEYLSGMAARAVAAIGEIVGRGLSKNDRAGSTKTCDLERVAPHRFGEEPGPLGTGAGGRKSGHVVDRFSEYWNPIRGPRVRPERRRASAARASASAVSARASIACHLAPSLRQRSSARAVTSAALHAPRRRPAWYSAIVPSSGSSAAMGHCVRGERGEGGHLCECFAAGRRHGVSRYRSVAPAAT